ncbi:H-NS family nucleoid-associated regulatory protein [Luteimonas sp. MC1750]|uniref:H-NS family nucleoid-associated regulatory protein n=1 Tax=Luteimonas sp. MC1750 TaxID=2799326 RepID=UPI0018F068E7|nr:H-NS family nucleoid-associated regulatory protein [Luteimonas sp. MC1750]MBJ6983988.1 H-NS histone family protein [Luteimonas sp. MC1750]QQO06800.1 H-NS histone family protein [Luteimonas sp. MC1750]
MRRLEALKGLLDKRDDEVPSAIEILAKYQSVMSDVQRRRIAKIIGTTSDAAADAAPVARKATKKSAKKAAKKAGSKAKVPAKFRLDSGEEWSGRGHPTREFRQWAESEKGKAWREANPGQKFPLIEDAAG